MRKVLHTCWMMKNLPFNFYRFHMQNFHIVQIEFNLSVLCNLLYFHVLMLSFTVFHLTWTEKLLWNLKDLTHVILKVAL